MAQSISLNAKGTRKRRTGSRFSVLIQALWDGRVFACFLLVFRFGVEKKKAKKNARATSGTRSYACWKLASNCSPLEVKLLCIFASPLEVKSTCSRLQASPAL
jgi:hypothetical protein